MDFLRVFKQTAGGLLDLVYPPRCLVCEQAGTPVICEECAAAFQPLPEPICTVCGRPSEGASCRLCERKREASGEGGWSFEAARAAAVFQGPLRHAIHRLKYNRAESLGNPLGAFLANRLAVDDLLPAAQVKRVEMVAAVPLHPSRERGRGYNQARLLAEPVAEMLDVPLLTDGILRRVRRTRAQVGLAPEERRRNLDAGMFAVTAPAAVAGRHLLLIDDVFTTGTTVDACAAALRNAGAETVLVATLAAGG